MQLKAGVDERTGQEENLDWAALEGNLEFGGDFPTDNVPECTAMSSGICGTFSEGVISPPCGNCQPVADDEGTFECQYDGIMHLVIPKLGTLLLDESLVKPNETGLVTTECVTLEFLTPKDEREASGVLKAKGECTLPNGDVFSWELTAPKSLFDVATAKTTALEERKTETNAELNQGPRRKKRIRRMVRRVPKPTQNCPILRFVKKTEEELHSALPGIVGNALARTVFLNPIHKDFDGKKKAVV